MKIRPLHDQVILRRNQELEKTAGGLYIPGNAQEKPLEGEVLAVGPGKSLDNGTVSAMTVATGDKVLFTKYATTEVSLDGEEYVILREDAILAILTNDQG